MFYLNRICLFIALLFSISAQASSVSPILLELNQRKPLTSVTYTNTAQYPVTIQVESFIWQQQNQENAYNQTQELTIVPVIVTIPSGSAQVFRVKWNGHVNLSEERAFRLIFEDITPDESIIGSGQAVTFRINHNIPVFVTPVNPTARVSWQKCESVNQKLCIRLVNQGNTRARFANLLVNGKNWSLPKLGGVTALAHQSIDLLFETNGQKINFNEVHLTGIDANGRSFSVLIK